MSNGDLDLNDSVMDGNGSYNMVINASNASYAGLDSDILDGDNSNLYGFFLSSSALFSTSSDGTVLGSFDRAIYGTAGAYAQFNYKTIGDISGYLMSSYLYSQLSSTYTDWGFCPDETDFDTDASATVNYSNAVGCAEKGSGSEPPPIVREEVLEGDSSPGSGGRFTYYVTNLRRKEGREATERFLADVLRNEDHPHRELALRFHLADLAHLGEDLRAVALGEEYLSDPSLADFTKSEIAWTLFSVYTESVKSLTGAARMRDLLRDYNHDAYADGLADRLLDRFAESVRGSVAFGKRDSQIIAPDYTLDIDVNAYPNPFRDSTTLEFTLEEPSEMTVTVFDLLGREVQRLAEGWLPEGQYHFRFTPEKFLAQGLYLYRLQSGEKSKVGRLIYVK